MNMLASVTIIAFVLIIPVYLYAVFHLLKIIRNEHPEWLQAQGSLSSLYGVFNGIGDPNVTVELIRIVYSSKVYQLQATNALAYAKWIRILLPAGLICFAVFVVAGWIASKH